MSYDPKSRRAATRRPGAVVAGAVAAAAIAATGGLPVRAVAADEPPVAPAPKAAPKSNAQIDAGEPRATTSPPGGASATAAQEPRPKTGAAAPGAGQPKAPGADRVELGTATVTGDREQPKVMYIVPWKSADIGDLSGKPMNSLLDEALSPVDRDVFKREVAYYDAVRGDAAPGGAAAAAKRVEK